MSCRNKIGVVHGRFQPFHNGHLDYVLRAFQSSEFLYVGLANPDPSSTSHETTDQKRGLPNSNPFTYYDRLHMVENALLEAGIMRESFSVVPFPINFPNRIKFFVPLDAMFYLCIYDAWGWEKKRKLEQLCAEVCVLEQGCCSMKLAGGKDIRAKMINGDSWENSVPPSVSKFIKSNGLLEKVCANDSKQ